MIVKTNSCGYLFPYFKLSYSNGIKVANEVNRYHKTDIRERRQLVNNPETILCFSSWTRSNFCIGGRPCYCSISSTIYSANKRVKRSLSIPWSSSWSQFYASSPFRYWAFKLSTYSIRLRLRCKRCNSWLDSILFIETVETVSVLNKTGLSERFFRFSISLREK